jgi:hypothetical protein
MTGVGKWSHEIVSMRTGTSEIFSNGRKMPCESIPGAEMTQMLSAEELQHYRQKGYVLPRFRLPDDLLQRLRQGVDAVLSACTDVSQEDIANPHMIPSIAGFEENPFMEAARHPRILDMVEQILGPDLVLWITRLLCKPPGKGREVPWHQDGEYWPMRPLETCSVWIALDPVSVSNGCMRFIPGVVSPPRHRTQGSGAEP